MHAWSDSEGGDSVWTPYMLLDWIDGNTLECSAKVPPPTAKRNVLAQLAQCSADLLVLHTYVIPHSVGTVMDAKEDRLPLDAYLNR